MREIKRQRALKRFSLAARLGDVDDPRRAPALPIRVGVVAGEPIRLEGLTSVFEREPEFGQSPLLPVIGTLDELLADLELEYLVIDLNASATRPEDDSRDSQAAPGLRLDRDRSGRQR